MSNLKSINNLKLLFTNYLPHPHITSTSVVLTYIFYLIIKWAEWVILDMYELIACICKNSWQHIWFFLSNIYIYIYVDTLWQLTTIYSYAVCPLSLEGEACAGLECCHKHHILYPLWLGPLFSKDGEILKPKVGLGHDQIINWLKEGFNGKYNSFMNKIKLFLENKGHINPRAAYAYTRMRT